MPSETATHKIPYSLGSDKPPSIPAITKSVAERIEALLSKGGDVTIAADGTVTISNNAVTAAKLASESVETAKIKALHVTAAKLGAEAVETAKLKALGVTTAKLAAEAVEEAKIADGAVSSRKFKPTRGTLSLSENLVLTEAYQAIKGLKLEITPPVASILLLWVRLNRITPVAQGAFTYKLDGVTEEAAGVSFGLEGNSFSVFFIALTAAAHTIEIMARRGGTAQTVQTPSQMNYMLVAS